MIVGVDVGGTKALCLALDPPSGNVLARAKASSSGTGPELVTTLVDLINRVESQTGLRSTAIGLGVAGLVTRGGTVRYSPNLPGLVEFALGPELEAQLGRTVVVSNDAMAATWAEYQFGAGRGSDDMVLVALGTGIGMGFVSNGQIAVGSNGFAGEAGHMVVDVDGPVHLTGQRGPWEYFASGNALGRLGRQAANSGDFELGVELAGEASEVTGFHVASGISEGDPSAVRILDDYCANVAVGLANLVMVLDPSRVVISGGVSDIGEPLRAGLDAALRTATLGAEHRPRVEVVLATMGSDSGAIGSALIASEIVRA